MPETRASGRMFLCPPAICREAELQKAGRPAFCLRRQTPAGPEQTRAAGIGGPSKPGRLIGRLPRLHFAGRAASAVATTTQLAQPLSLPAVPVCAALMPGRRRGPHHLPPPFATHYDPML